jgi:hypothetical protein
MTYAKQDRDRHDDVAGRGQGIVNVCDPRPVGIAFGNGILNQPTSTLFFTAGPDDETHGLYGRIDVAP